MSPVPASPAPASTVPSAPPVLRLLPAPCTEPPYDDERVSPPELRLVLNRAPRPVPGAPGPHAGHAPVPASPERPLPADVPRARTRTADLPDVRCVARALVHRLVEVRGGVRPITQLRRDTTPGLYADLERDLTRRPRAAGPRPTGRDVRSVHVQERPDGVAEVCATVRRGDRVGALALRLEGVHGTWVCTQLQGL